MGYEVKKWNHYSIFYQVFLTCCIDFENVRCKTLTSHCTKNIIYYVNICSRYLWWIRYLKSDFRVSGLSQTIEFMTSWKRLFYNFLDLIWWFFKNSTVLNPIPSHGISKKPKPKFWVTKHHYYCSDHLLLLHSDNIIRM